MLSKCYAAVIGYGFIGAVANAQVVYEQLPATGSALISAAQSDAQFGYANRRRADNFTLVDDVLLKGLTFWGGDESNEPAVALSNLAGFNIVIHRDNGSGPAVPFAVYDYDRSDVTITPEGETVGLLFAERHRFEILFDAARTISLPAGDYVLSIAARYNAPVNFTNEAFQWAASLPGDGVFYSDSYDGNGYQFAGSFARTDASFQLIGEVEAESCPTDVTGDGVTDISDLLLLLARFDTSCDG